MKYLNENNLETKIKDQEIELNKLRTELITTNESLRNSQEKIVSTSEKLLVSLEEKDLKYSQLQLKYKDLDSRFQDSISNSETSLRKQADLAYKIKEYETQLHILEYKAETSQNKKVQFEQTLLGIFLFKIA